MFRILLLTLSFDLVFSEGSAIFLHGDGWVLLHSVARLIWLAVHAGVDGAALHVLGLVLLASHVWDAVLVHPLVGSIAVSTVARSSGTAVDQG